MSKQLTNIAKGIIMVFAMMHLTFANIQVRALLLLEHELCGFIMFMFVLMGLIALFEATRIKRNEVKERIFTVAVCLVTGGLGGYLISIYRSAIRFQRSLDVIVVNKAAIFSTIIVVAYVVAGSLIVIDLLKRK